MEVLSKDAIKPSSSTPQHLPKLNLSFLDQLAPPIYVHLIFFYQTRYSSYNLDEAQTISQNLKHSLSDVLTKFYPLAGRIIQENSCIDCNDDGVEYVETRVHAQLLNITKNPNMEELKKYVPMEPEGLENGMGQSIPLAVQVNFFDCGGIAIGVCVSHKIADAGSLVCFMHAWAATCRRETEVIQPSFDLTCRFPPVDPSKFSQKSPPTPPSDIEIAQKVVTKRFVFDKEKLALLKEAVAAEVKISPTKVEAITAFIWLHIMRAAKEDKGKKNLFTAGLAVNLRSRANPPLPQHYFGNACAKALALSTSNEEEQAHNVLVTKLKSAIRKIDQNYIEKMQNGNEYLDQSGKLLADQSCSMEASFFTSWCRFPVYEVDYGWGKPLWVSTIGVPFKNLVVLMDTSCGDGIEAWVNTGEEGMDMIERNYQLLSLAALDIKT